MSDILCIEDIKNAASARLDVMTREFINLGADDCITVEENEKAFQRYRLRPRVFRDMSKIDTSSNLFGFKLKMPFGIAPASMQKLCHIEGEMATSKAATKFAIPMGVSTISTVSLENIISVKPSDVPYFMQLYVFQDRDTTIEMIKRAEKAGYTGLILTVDAPVHGRRRNEVRNRFSLPDHIWPANFSREDFKLPMTKENESQSTINKRSSQESSSTTKKQKGLNGKLNQQLVPFFK